MADLDEILRLHFRVTNLYEIQAVNIDSAGELVFKGAEIPSIDRRRVRKGLR